MEFVRNTNAFVDDLGTKLYLVCSDNLADATEVTILVEKPDKTEHTWLAEVYNDSLVWSGRRYKAGIIVHTIEAGDFDQRGRFYFNSHVVTPEGKWTGETVMFVVKERGQL